MASLEIVQANLSPDIQSQCTSHSRKRRKKSRLIKQGYHKSERDDARRVAARAFLSGIPLDSQQQSLFPVGLPPDASYQSQLRQDVLNSTITSQRPPSSVSRHSNVLQVDGDQLLVPGVPDRPHDMVLDSPKLYHMYRQHSPAKVQYSRSLDRDLESPPYLRDFAFIESNLPSFTDTTDKKLLNNQWQSFESEGTGNVHICNNMMKLPATMVVDRRYTSVHIILSFTVFTWKRSKKVLSRIGGVADNYSAIFLTMFLRWSGVKRSVMGA